MIEAALKRPYVIIVAALAVLVVGVTSYQRIPADLLPVFKTPAVQIVTFYPGMPPMVMPFDPTASVPLCLVSVSSTEMSEKELYDIAYFELRNRLQAISGVIAPAVYGGKLRRVLAYVDREKLDARGLSLLDVQEALLRENVLIPAGNAKMGGLDFQIFTNALPETVEALNDTPIKQVDGAPVLMRDVGEVRDAGQIQSNIVRINGARQVYIPIYRQPGANTIEIVDGIKARLARILSRLKEMNSDDPKMQSLVLSVAMDQSVGVRQSITGLQLAGGLGAALAGLVVLLFLRSFQLSLIIFLSIPLSILASVIGLYFTGDSINAMTLGGLALAIGILVDQSIVVLENIVRHVRMGKPSHQAALQGTREVAGPIFVSTVTFCVVFFPVVFLSGMAKFLFTPLAVAATVAIVASYFISITLVPAYCARIFRNENLDSSGETVGNSNSGSSEKNASEGGDGRPEVRWLGTFGRLLDRVITIRYAVVAVVLALFAAAVWSLSRSGRELFPPVDAGQAMVQAKESEVAFRQAEFNRINALAKRGSINREMVDEVKYHLESARGGLSAEAARIEAKRAALAARETDVAKAIADHQAAQARVELASADLEYLKEMANYGTIHSPTDGVIIKRMVDPGAFIQPADGNSAAGPLVTVSRVDRVRVSFQLPMAEVRWLDRGDRAVLDRINVLPGARFEGEVTRFTTALNKESRLMRVEVELDNSDGRLRPGYYGYMKVFLEEMPQTPVVPASAFMSDKEGSFVYVVDDNVCRRQEVTNIYQDGSIVGIGSGLKPGEQIVQTGGGTLADGQRVVAVPTEPAAG